MALQDILAAITAEADLQIEEARAAHHKELSGLREESERRIAGKKQEIAKQKERKKTQLTAKANAHAQVQKRNVILKKKKELLDQTYAKVIERLSELPDKDVEPLLRACVQLIKIKGEIRPSEKHVNILKKLCPKDQFKIGATIKASGGFLFVSEKQEEDFTFEHLVEHVLRPDTELEISKTLFS